MTKSKIIVIILIGLNNVNLLLETAFQEVGFLLPNLNFGFLGLILILIMRFVKREILKNGIYFSEVIFVTFQENLNRICKERGTTLTTLVKGMGLSTSKVSRWNEGALPKQEMLLRLAKELDCSVMDFFADEDDLPTAKPDNEDEEDILRIYRSLSRRQKHEFMAMVYNFEDKTELEGDKEETQAV